MPGRPPGARWHVHCTAARRQHRHQETAMSSTTYAPDPVTAAEPSLRGTSLRRPWNATAIGAALPFVLTFYQLEIHRENDVVVSSWYRDWGALIGAIVLAIVGLTTIPSVVRRDPPRRGRLVLLGVALAVAL